MKHNTHADDWGYPEDSNLYSTLSTYAILILLPVFFFYQIFIAYRIIPAFAGGYFTAACLTLLPFLFLAYFLSNAKSGIIQMQDFIYFLFLAYFIVVAAANRALGADQYLLEWHIISAAHMACIYLAFKGAFVALLHNRYKIILSALITASLVISLSSGGVFNPRSLSDGNESLASYQGFAFSLFILSCMSIPLTKSATVRVALYAIFLIALYLNGARSEFAGFVVFSVAYEFFRSKSKSVGIILISTVILIAVAVFASGTIEIPSNRVTNLLDLQSDNSSNVRDEIASSGMEKILNNPLTGSYGDYERGYYIHNIFSAWQELGLLGFAFFSFILTAPIAILSTRVLVQRLNNKANCMILAMLCSCLVLLVFGKYFTYLVTPAALGLYSGLVRSNPHHNGNRHTTSDMPDGSEGDNKSDSP